MFVSMLRVHFLICMHARVADTAFCFVPLCRFPPKQTPDRTHTHQAYVSNFTEQFEDPEVMLDRVTDEMQEDLIKMRQATAKVRTG